MVAIVENPEESTDRSQSSDHISANQSGRGLPDLTRLESALQPYEKKLAKQETFRRRLGVVKVEEPTYQRYVTGTIQRFEKERMAFLCMRPENPHGDALRKKFKKHTGYDHYLSPLPYAELEIEDRFGRALADAGYRA